MTREEAEDGQEIFRKVVNISSIAGLGGNAGQVNYFLVIEKLCLGIAGKELQEPAHS